ncbi:MAG: OmpA family protein [Betaproteobacteria bacterium]|nr:OmpA family protein [Betaproteobacteria bacterium]
MTVSASAIIGAVTLAVLTHGLALAQDAKNQGYLLDQNMNVVTSATTGVCVRTSDWTPARAIEQCDPKLVKKPAQRAAESPHPPAPPKKPTPAPTPDKLLSQKLNLYAEALFDFDRSVLKPKGKAMLDDFAQTLRGAKHEVILATGHTDRIGTAAYNQKLSERRAEAVKDYLVSKGIEANRIHAEGKGETEPITKPGDCKGIRSKKLIACLQPDRRVEVEVAGTKEGRK